MQQILDTVRRTLEALVAGEKVETGEASITMATLAVAFAEDPALAERIENAIFMVSLSEGEPTEAEVGAMLDEQAPPAYRPAPNRNRPRVSQGKLVEGVDNDGLTDVEATAALDEQHACTADCPPA